jgi:multiple sugar transport system permease protein
MKKKYELYDIVSNGVIILFAVLNLFPLYWLISGSFKTSAAIYKMPPDWIPASLFLENYTELFKNQPAFRWLFNSFFVSFTTTLIVVVISAMGAYAFAKLKFRGKNILFFILISSLFVPKEVFIIPLFRIIIALGWSDSYAAMIFPNVATAFGLFLLKGFFSTIPDSIRESGKMDGASEFTIFMKLMIPVVKPGIGALFILNFVQVWNDYLWQLLTGTSKDMKTLMVGVASLMQEIYPNMGFKMAGATVAAIPMIIIFLAFQKYFTAGISVGAVKE